MAYKIIVQDGIVDVASINPLTVETIVNIAGGLNVGDDGAAPGQITTNGADLIISPGAPGNLKLNPSVGGSIIINNVTWPSLSSVTPGSYLGASDSTTLEFYPFVIAFNPSDTLTQSQLNSSYPTAQAGQSVVGPSVIYQCVSAGTWRTLAGGSGIVTSFNTRTGNVVLASSDVTSALGYTPINKAGDTVDGVLTFPGSSGITITGLPTPLNPSDATNKAYVDGIATSLNIHGSAEVGTTTSLSADYFNGVLGVGATLTANPSVPLPLIDGYTAGITARILVKNQADNTQNGIYVVTQVTAPWILTRADDYDNSLPEQVKAGDYVFISEGSSQANTGWVEIGVGTGFHDSVIIGTDSIIFSQFSGAGTYQAGTGLSLTGNIFANTGVLTLTTGSGLSLNTLETGNVSITNTGVTIATAGTGINVSSGTGNVTISNSGVTSLTAGSNISLSGSTGSITISASGTIPSATTANNLAGGLATEIPFQSAPSTTTFSPNLTFDSGTNTFSVGGSGSGVISALPGQTLQIESDTLLQFLTNSTLRISINSNGSLEFNGTTGTSGQVLTSTGSGSTPTWQTISSTPSLTSTQIAYGDATNILTSSSSFTWTNSSYRLTLGDSLASSVTIKASPLSGNGLNLYLYAGDNTGAGSAGNMQIVAGSSTGDPTSAGLGGALLIQGGYSGGSNAVGGSVTINGGTATSGTGGTLDLRSGVSNSGNSGALTIAAAPPASGATAGLVTIRGGDQITGYSGLGGSLLVRGGNSGQTANTGNGGLLTLQGGNSANDGIGGNISIDAGIVNSATTGYGGDILIRTGTSSLTERLRIKYTGEWQLAGSAGTPGQFLLSNGAGTPPTWSNTSTSLTTSGNATVGGNLIRSVATGISAAGVNQATATGLTKDINVVSTVSSGQGVALPAEIAGETIIVINTSATSLNVYPNSGAGQIDSNGIAAAFSLPAGARIMFICVSSTQWYTLNATYS